MAICPISTLLKTDGRYLMLAEEAGLCVCEHERGKGTPNPAPESSHAICGENNSIRRTNHGVTGETELPWDRERLGHVMMSC